MLQKIIKRLKNAYQTLLVPISICKSCFNDVKTLDIYSLMNKDTFLCCSCLHLLDPKFKIFKIEGKIGLTLFEYDVLMKDLIYRFKGCFDYELKNVFLNQFKNELSVFYRGYTMVPAPSFEEDNRKRGFNHVVEIFRPLKLEMLDLFEKTERFKQADHNFKDRKKIKKYIKLKNNISIPNKILLVDDIYTTGSTIQAMILLLKERGISNIKVLVLCKTVLSEKKGD